MRQRAAFFLVFFMILVPLFSQTGEGPVVDVPFLWGVSWEPGARALSMAGAYSAVADRQTAMHYNPAGLGRIRNSEISATFSQMNYTNQVTSLGSVSEETNGYTKLNDLGLTLPIPTYRGSLVFGFAYRQARQMDGALMLSRFASHFSAYDSITVNYNNFTDGGLTTTSLGGALEVSPDLYLGLSLNIWGGSRDYNSRFKLEDEPYNYYYWSKFDSTDNTVTQFSGLNLTLGMLYEIKSWGSVSAVIKTPLNLKAKEDWSYLDDPVYEPDVPDDVLGYYPPYYDEGSGYSEYKIRSPWIFRFGGALSRGPLTLSGDIEFYDYSQIRYQTDTAYEDIDQASANIIIRQSLKNIKNIYLGGELAVPGTDFTVRGGYAVRENPVKSSADKNTKLWAVGAGYRFSSQFLIDAAYARTKWNGPGASFISEENIEASKVAVTITYQISMK